MVLGTWTLLADVPRRERRVVAANGHEVRDAGLDERLDDRARRFGRLRRVLARGAQHGSALEVHP
jgi:hypothetical protein